jgi:hypothetical protein
LPVLRIGSSFCCFFFERMWSGRHGMVVGYVILYKLQACFVAVPTVSPIHRMTNNNKETSSSSDAPINKMLFAVLFWSLLSLLARGKSQDVFSPTEGVRTWKSFRSVSHLTTRRARPPCMMHANPRTHIFWVSLMPP